MYETSGRYADAERAVPAFAGRQEMDDAVLARRALARLIVELLPTGLRVL